MSRVCQQTDEICQLKYEFANFLLTGLGKLTDFSESKIDWGKIFTRYCRQGGRLIWGPHKAVALWGEEEQRNERKMAFMPF